MKRPIGYYDALRQTFSPEKEGEDFFKNLDAIKDQNKQKQEEKRIEFASDYAARIYGIDKAQLIIPEQGEQTFSFIAKDRVIRLARWPIISKAMENEVEVMRVLEGHTSSQIPSVLDFKPAQHIMSISRLPGTTLLSEERFLAFSKTTQESILRRIGKFLGEMHNRFPTTDKIEKPWWKEQTIQKIEAHLEQETNTETRERLQKAAEYAKAYGENGKESFVMLHGDLHGGNVMYDEESDLLGFIDFTSVKFGAAPRDFYKLRRVLPNDLYNIIVSSYEETTGRTINQEAVLNAVDCFCIMTNNPFVEIGPTKKYSVRKNQLACSLNKA